jgi:hypothetical protein
MTMLLQIRKLMWLSLISVVSISMGYSIEKKDLHDAMVSGNLRVVQQHLAAGADVNAVIDNLGSTLLYGAYENGHEHIIRELLYYGAYVENKNYLRRLTPFEQAVVCGSKEEVRLLLLTGNVCGDREEVFANALRLAAGQGRIEIMELFISSEQSCALALSAMRTIIARLQRTKSSLELLARYQHIEELLQSIVQTRQPLPQSITRIPGIGHAVS